MAIEPELEFVPEQEQDLEFAPLSQEEAGNLTKADYLASGGAPEDVISPEREAVLQQETQRQLQAGATPQQASIEAGKAVDAMGTIRRLDGTIAEGYKPTSQALAEGIIETPAIPAVKEAQRLGIETVSSGTDKATGVGFAIGRNKDGKVVRFEADKDGNVDSFELEPEEPSRLGAIARTVASQVIPATTGAVAAETAAALTPGGILPKLATGAIAGIGGFIAGQKGQEAAGKALLGPERMARISEVLQRDVEKYPITTTAASILTPTGGGLVGLAKGVRGALTRPATQAAEAVAPAVAPAVEAVVPKAAIAATENVPTKTFYHGSPATSIENIKSDARGLVFVSESKDVSSSYRLSRTKDVDLNKAGLTNEERLSYDMYRKGLREDPTANPDQFLSQKEFDEASSALEKIEAYKKTLAEQGKIYEINIPTDKIIDWRNPDNFYKTLSAVEADLRTSGETTLANILRNSISNKIPPQSGLLGKPVFDSLKKQGIEGVTLPHSREGSETLLIRNALGVPPKAEQIAVKAAEPIQLPTPGVGEKIRKTPQRIIEQKLAPEATMREVAKGDVLYKTKSIKELEQQFIDLSNEDVISAANSRNDIVGDVAKVTMYKRYADAGDAVRANQYLEMVTKPGTDLGQRLNVFKLIKMEPSAYASAVAKVVEKSGYRIDDAMAGRIANLKKLSNSAENRFNSLAEKARNSLDDVDIKAAINAENNYTKSLYDLQIVEGRLIPKKLFAETLPTIIQGNLLSPISLTTNIWSNVINAPLRMASRQGAFLTQEVGRAFQALAGKELGPRLIAPPTGGITRTIEAGKAGLRGLGEGLVGVRRGLSAEGLLSGEKIKGFKPLTAFKQFWTGEGLAKPIQKGFRGASTQALDRLRLATEATLGVPAETMLRLLQLGDAPFRRIAQARLLSEQAQLAGLTGKALQVAVRLPTAKQLSKIEQEAAEAVFQQDTVLTRAALSAANLFGAGNKSGIARLIGKSIIPYAKTPANVIDEMLEFSLPPYALIKAVRAVKSKDYRTSQMMIGKALTGSVLIGVAKTLSDAGIIGGKPSVSEKVRDVQYQTLTPRSINLSALNRFANGESTEIEPGDKVISLDKMGITGAILSIINSSMDATKQGKEGSFEFSSLLPETLSFAFNQSFLKGTNSLLSAMMDGSGATLDKWISDYYGVVASIPFPNTLNAVSRSMRETMPEKFQIKDVPGDGVERMINVFGEVLSRRLPSMDEDMPRRIDIWGREVPQTPEGADPIAYNFFDVTKGREVSYDPITLGIYKIFKATDDGDVVPPKPLRNFTLRNVQYRLDPELYEKYARMRGRASRRAAEAMFADNTFKRMKDEDKVIVLRSAYARVGDDVRKEFISKYENRIKRGQKQ
jgi:hypothetical protein